MPNSTVVGVLELSPSFEHIAIYSHFSGDDNGNNRVIAEYRRVGRPTWIPVQTPDEDMQPGELTVDRRTQLARSTYDSPGELYYTDNPWQNQWRGLIFFLQPNTDYEVRLTYTDPDGGSQVVTGQVRTLNDNPPSTGIITTVDQTTVQAAVNSAQPGDVIRLLPGVYNETITFSGRAGLPNNGILFESSDPNNPAVLDGQRSLSRLIIVSGSSHIRFRNLVLRNINYGSQECGLFDLRGPSHDLIIQHCDISGIAGGWRGSGIFVRTESGSGNGPPAYNILIDDTTIVDGNPSSRTPRNLIGAWNPGGRNISIRNCYLEGPYCEDGVASSSDLMQEWYVYNNRIEAGYDDNVEFEGENINSACWGNTFINPWRAFDENTAFCRMAIGLAPVVVGPLYIFRNTMWKFGDATLKLGNSSAGRVYFFHNTIYGRPPASYGNNSLQGNMVWRNNIVVAFGGNLMWMGGPTDWMNTHDFDYDIWDGPTNVHWGSEEGYGITFAEWQSGMGALLPQEVNGLYSDPLLVDPEGQDFRLQDTSPAIDRGVVLVGFNDANSPWPYRGNAPDVGARESGIAVEYPTADFSFDPISGIVPLTVAFTNLSTGEIDSWSWNFGDGQTSAELNPTHTYILPGNYAVTLTVSGPSGSDTLEALVSVFSIPFILTIEAAPGGTTDPAPGQLTFNEGTIVPVTALPAAGYRFLEWREGVAIGTENPIPILMDSDRTITPVFEIVTAPPGEFTVTISVLGEGTTDPPVGAYSIIEGELLTITAIPASGFVFDHWEGDVTGVANPITIQITSDISIVAVFVEKPPLPFLVSASILASVLGIITSLIRSKR